jgi:XRE family transcriptional regulator, regulator of sulfur utilization
MRHAPVRFACDARSIPSVHVLQTCSVAPTRLGFESWRPCPPWSTARMPRRRDEPDPMGLKFGGAVRAARQAREETLEDVAGRIPKLDPRYLGELELGYHVPSIATAKRLADALELSLAELVQGL